MRSPDRYTSAVELAARIRRREITPTDAVEAALDRIDRRNDAINAVVTVLEEDARERARAAESALEAGRPIGPLHGVPILLKDLFDFKAGVRNTIGSKPFRSFVPETTAPYVERLEAAGAIVIGKTNVPEFGHKGTTDNALFGPTKSPFDLGTNAGGSSGGSAAAVADGLVPVAQGSDGGGSVRIPAAMCGVYGFKPSYGRIPQAGRPDGFVQHTPFIHIGAISRSVEDAAVAVETMAGPHERDPMSLPDDGTDLTGAVGRGIEGLDIAYSPTFDVFPVAAPVRSVVGEAVEAFADAGATVDRVELGLEASHRELCNVWIREIGVQYHSVLEGFKREGIDLLGTHRDELTPEFRDLLDRTRGLSAKEHRLDEHVRTRVFDALQDAFAEYDLLVTPTLAVASVENDPEGGTVGPSSVDGEPVDPLIGWCLTYPVNFTGHPAASVPAGLTDAGHPVGMQVIGPRLDDEAVIAASAALERARPWHEWYPPR